MCEAFDDHEGSFSIGGRLITNIRFADDIVINADVEQVASWRRGRPSHYNHRNVQNGNRSR